MQLFTNNADTTLNGAITSGSLSITVNDGSLFPVPTGGDYFLLTLFQKSGTSELNHEIVKCTARAANVLTVVRAQEGTTAKAFNNADPVELRVTAGSLSAKQDVVVSAVHIKTVDSVNIVGSGNATLSAVYAPIAHVGGTGAAHGNAVAGGVAGFMTGADKTKLDAVSGSNTGDETLATIKTKLGITTLSGSNTGDQVIPTTLPASDVSAWAKAGTKPAYTFSELTGAIPSPTITTPVITGLKESKVVVAASAIDLTAGNYFTKTATGALTWTVPTGVPTTGTVGSFILELTNGGLGTQTWMTGIKWAGAVAPTLTSAGRDILAFFTHDAGTTWNGFLLAKDIK